MNKQPGSSLKKAFKIKDRDVSDFRNRDRIGGDNSDDLYRFKVKSSSNGLTQVDIDLSRLQKNADLELYSLKRSASQVNKAIGKLEFSQIKPNRLNKNLAVVASSTKKGKRKAESISTQLEAGTYYIRVFSKSAKETRYKLDLATSPIALPDGPEFQQLWIQQRGSNQDDQGLAVVTSRNTTNIYIAGSTGGSPLDATASDTDAFIAKYSTSGIESWFEEFGGLNTDQIRAITVDATDNVYGVGATEFIPQTGLSLPESSGYLAKYSANGQQLFAQQVDKTGIVIASGVAVNGNNTIYAAGQSLGVDLTNFQVAYSPILTQYSADGQFQADIDLNLSGQGFASKVYVDAQNNIFVTGLDNVELSLTNLENPIVGDVFVKKYNASGQQLWSTLLASEDADFVNGLALDPSGNVYVTGDTLGNLPGNTNAGDFDGFLAKFSPEGNRLWVKQYGTPQLDKSVAISINSAGNVYVAGETSGSLFGDNVGEADAWLAAFDADGNSLGNLQIGTSANDRINGMSIDANGNLYVVGDTAGNLGGTNQGGSDIWLAQYSFT